MRRPIAEQKALRPFLALAGVWLFFVGMCALVGRSNTAGHGQAATAVMNAILAATTASIGWCAVESLRRFVDRTWTARGKTQDEPRAATGAVVAGIAAIASGAVYLDIPWAMLTSFVAGVVAGLCGVRKCPDPYGASPLFAALATGGTIGVVATGIFATRAVAGPTLAGSRLGVLENGPLLSQHLAALVVVWLYAGAVSYTLSKFAWLAAGAPSSSVEASA